MKVKKPKISYETIKHNTCLDEWIEEVDEDD